MESLKRGLNSNQLKLIAIAVMTIDHLTWVLCAGYSKEWYAVILHIIGRITAPIMWFMIAEGYYYTKNLKKYIFRLFVFAIISHFAYNFFNGNSLIPFKYSVFNQTSVIWSLAWGVVALALTDEKRFRVKQWVRVLIVIGICGVTFCSDWSCIAVLAILGIYNNKGNFKKQVVSMMAFVLIYAVVYFVFMDKVYGVIQLFVILSAFFLKRYNGERGKWKGMKWLFYVYYPLHLFLLGGLRVLIK